MLNTACHKKIAVVLFQLGGPDSLDTVRPFLSNLFSDPDIIDIPFPFLFRKFLVRFISSRRSDRVKECYRLIGGRSPILDLTKRQAEALQTNLARQSIEAQIYIAMRYWHPTTEKVIKEIKENVYERIILLPLYPQFSRATTFSSIKEWKRQANKNGLKTPTDLICCYPNHPLLIEAFVENINLALIKFSGISPEKIDLVFSAHGIPESYIKKGDPYKLHVEETVQCILASGKWNSPHTLCYQSKVGPVQWLKPSLVDTVEQLARDGHKNLLIIPVSFVTDHIETLYEIDIRMRNHAATYNIERFELMPALNDNPKFILCLSEIVKSKLLENAWPDTCDMLYKRRTDQPAPKLCPRKNT